MEEKRKIQKLVFPEGIVVDTTKRTYLTSKVNFLFLAKSELKRTSEGVNNKLPIKSDEESSLVAGVVLLSLRLHESRRECFTTRSPYSLCSYVLFIPHHLQKQAFDVWEIKNPVHFRTPGFS